MRARLIAADRHVVEAQRERRITPARAATLRRQLAHSQREMAQFYRQQGFVSAAELASYDRQLGEIDAELTGRAAARSYGNDVVPSAEMVAFQKADARLRYRNARLEFDGRNCAVYQGTARDGRIRREPLLSEAGRPICTRR